MTCGTLFESAELPLNNWFQAVVLVTQIRDDLSELSLKHHLGVCDRTAWPLKQKLLEAMAERKSSRLVTGVVVADDAVVGGKPAATNADAAPKARRCPSPRWAG
jgi:hypothetical protein